MESIASAMRCKLCLGQATGEKEKDQESGNYGGDR